MTHSTRTPSFPANSDDYAPWVAKHGLYAPYGECQCGCGQKTTISPHSNKSAGLKIREPIRFISGHNGFKYEWPDGPNPSGLCMCGCGQKTQIERESNQRLGNVRGKPRRFLLGHQHRSASLEAAFWQYAKRGSNDECWHWQGTIQNTGYGAIWYLDKLYLAHRVSWEIHNGPIPDGMNVCHECDNPPCWNPAHLFVGSDADNMADKVAKGRQPRGETNGNARITEAQVIQIRALRASGYQQQELADMFGISQPTVGQIVRRVTWKHIP